jgi:GNAT superfamily N-acetyltransferase
VTHDLRRATPADRGAILALLERSMHRHADPRFADLFAWKHDENAFGPSPTWVCTVDGKVVGVRAFLRWELVVDGRALRVVRAVDTATDPDHQGRGIFRRLTLHAIDELRDEGVAFVFNTPNDQSRPGYLSMGWEIVGRLPVRFRPRSPTGLMRMLRARVPADHWSADASFGVPAADVLDDPGLDALCARLRPGRGVTTRRDRGFLRWRYGWPELRYRAVVAAQGLEEGVALIRLRRRGAALEAAVAEVLVPDGEARARRALVRRALREMRADYAIAIGRQAPTPPFAPLPGQGPVLAWRAVADPHSPAPLRDWHLGLGDIELF